MNRSARIDIIIPVYRNALVTKLCIESIRANIHEIRRYLPRLLVINDSPDDREVNSMLDDLTASSPDVAVLTNTEHLGFVKSVNRGFDLACRAGHDVILVNSDTESFAGTLAELVDAAYSDRQIGFACPRSNNASICSLPHLSPSAPRLSPAESYHRWKEIGATLPRLHYTPTAIGFYLFVKHEILANFGGFRIAFGLGYQEENDLIMRANKCGYRAVFANRSFAFHAGSASFKLLDFDLEAHQRANTEMLYALHPEFGPSIARYLSSAHFKAESLLSGLIGRGSGPVKAIIDITGLGGRNDGTYDVARGIIESLARRHRDRFELSVLCSTLTFDELELGKFGSIGRADLASPGQYAIAIRLGPPLNWHEIKLVEAAAPINVFAIFDTTAEDGGYLSAAFGPSDLWRHVARHANGLFFMSSSSEKAFCARFSDALGLPKYARLLPTKLSGYGTPLPKVPAEHVLVLGGHLPHKAVDATAEILSAAFPHLRFVATGARTFEKGNLRGYRSDSLESEAVSRLISKASVVVLPSYVEGFGFGVLRALAGGKPIVARNIASTREILATYQTADGVHLFDDDTDIRTALSSALKGGDSVVINGSAIGWDEWVDGLADFLMQSLSAKDLFDRLRDRIHATERLGDAVASEDAIVAAKNLDSLLRHEDRHFVVCAYLTILKRRPDPEGLANHLTLLRRGTSKMQILSSMKNSPEGRNVEGELEGMRASAERYKWYRWPRIGSLFGSRR
jgi:GT2 family glycosyltransferase